MVTIVAYFKHLSEGREGLYENLTIFSFGPRSEPGNNQIRRSKNHLIVKLSGSQYA